MKKLIFLALLYFSAVGVILAQDLSDTIEVRKVVGSYKYFQNGRMLYQNDLGETLKRDQNAYAKYRSSKTSATTAAIFQAVGGFMLGWPIGTAIAGGEPNWSLAVIGAGSIVFSIPFSISANRKMREGVDIYNRNIGKGVSLHEGKLGITQNGISLIFHLN